MMSLSSAPSARTPAISIDPNTPPRPAKIRCPIPSVRIPSISRSRAPRLPPRTALSAISVPVMKIPLVPAPTSKKMTSPLKILLPNSVPAVPIPGSKVSSSEPSKTPGAAKRPPRISTGGALSHSPVPGAIPILNSALFGGGAVGVGSAAKKCNRSSMMLSHSKFSKPPAPVSAPSKTSSTTPVVRSTRMIRWGGPLKPNWFSV